MKKCINGAATKREQRITVKTWSKVTTVGIDLGDRFSHYCGLDEAGNIVIEERIPTTAASLELAFKRVSPKRIAIETGTHSPWISRLLTSLGHEVLVANARKLRLIYENRRKNDRIDAEYLARVARLDPKLLSAVEHRSEESQCHLEILRARQVLVATRTRVVNHIRGAVKSFGGRIPACAAECFHTRAGESIPASLRAILAPLLGLLADVTKQIRAFDREIEQLAEDRYPDTDALVQVRGIGRLTALAFVLTLEDEQRFRRSRSVGAWLGLVPERDDSGESEPQKGISKEGNGYLRRLLVGSAQYILGPYGTDCDLRRHGLAIAERGGKNAKKRAAVAVARKLAVLLHRLWRTRDIYEPLRNAERRAA